MRLREHSDNHSVYVLYSDLLFNLVIIFLLVVLALVLRLNHTMREVAAGHHPLATAVPTQVQSSSPPPPQVVVPPENPVAREMKELGYKLSIAAGANRFTGRTGPTSFCVGVDFSGRDPRYVLINSSIFESAHSNLDGESEEAHLVRTARLLTRACEGAPRFSLDELRPLFRAIQTIGSRDKSGVEGELIFSFSGRASAAASGWFDSDGEINVARAESALRRLDRLGSFGEANNRAIDRLLELRDSLRVMPAPESVPVLHFSRGGDSQHVLLGSTQITVESFRRMVSAFGGGGLILQYDAQDQSTCPPDIINTVLTPVGYTNSVPDPEQLRQLRQVIERKSDGR